MSKNTIYSYSYHQPEDYRFSLDSVFLAQKVAEVLKTHHAPETLRVLDLCSGCGVVGLELNFNLKSVNKIDFLEVQDVYRPFFEKNAEQAKSESSEFNFLCMNYADLLKDSFKEKYDVIVSNPPYFFMGEGLLSPNEFKNRCRFFIDSDFKILISSTLYSLKPEGRAFLLVRPGTHHGRNLQDEIKKLSAGLATVQVLDEVRGTNIVELIKNS
ncbi:MAG: methyltransferase [Rhizobacter sp.]|nr:methyltransferase [Bacteriovorax sp.]